MITCSHLHKKNLSATTFKAEFKGIKLKARKPVTRHLLRWRIQTEEKEGVRMEGKKT